MKHIRKINWNFNKEFLGTWFNISNIHLGPKILRTRFSETSSCPCNTYAGVINWICRTKYDRFWETPENIRILLVTVKWRYLETSNAPWLWVLANAVPVFLKQLEFLFSFSRILESWNFKGWQIRQKISSKQQNRGKKSLVIESRDTIYMQHQLNQ